MTWKNNRKVLLVLFVCLASKATKSILIKFKKIFMKRLQISRRDLDVCKRGMPVRLPRDLQSLMCLKQKLRARSQLLLKYCWMQNRNISSTHIQTLAIYLYDHTSYTDIRILFIHWNYIIITDDFGVICVHFSSFQQLSFTVMQVSICAFSSLSPRWPHSHELCSLH